MSVPGIVAGAGFLTRTGGPAHARVTTDQPSRGKELIMNLHVSTVARPG
jgi:hypothetical protein